MKKNFKKSDLKTGMRVVCDNNEEFIVFIGSFETANYGKQKIMLCDEDGFMIGDDYDDDLIKETCLEEYSIKEVYESPSGVLPNKMLEPSYKGDLLWQREEPFITLDGVDYSEKTLRSIIKKATS